MGGLRKWGFRVWGLRFGVWGLGFRVEGLYPFGGFLFCQDYIILGYIQGTPIGGDTHVLQPQEVWGLYDIVGYLVGVLLRGSHYLGVYFGGALFFVNPHLGVFGGLASNYYE